MRVHHPNRLVQHDGVQRTGHQETGASTSKVHQRRHLDSCARGGVWPDPFQQGSEKLGETDKVFPRQRTEPQL
jgi:hypothetical protein